jgi:UDP-N-acetylmuramoyl-tripeptide--D-alanyl-D-alanine ligase
MSDRFVMVPTTLTQILAVLAPGWSVEGADGIVAHEVCVDSRQVGPGSLFVALPGERVDGHDYVLAALAAGARIALVERPVADLPCVDTVDRSMPASLGLAVTVRVHNTLAALQCLAAARRRMYRNLRVIGITGSVGKTTTKEAVASVLGARYRVLRSGGNRNNEIGLPLTLLMARPEDQYAVLEMGMYQIGEIADLCRIAEPQAGLVTNVEPVHLERLGTIERIAEAKAELVRALPADGWVALNADDPRVVSMSSLTEARAVTYGFCADANVRASDMQSLGLQGNSFTVRVGLATATSVSEPVRRLRTRMLGPTAVRAALAGVTVGLLEGLSWEDIQEGLDQLGQGLRLVSRQGANGITILDDSYNASPSAVLSALQFLAGLKARRVAVLGDMLELGAVEAEGHRQVGRMAAETCDLLVAVGDRASDIAAAAAEAGFSSSNIVAVADNAAAVSRLAERLQDGDVVLIKGSRGMHMEEIVAALQEGAP